MRTALLSIAGASVLVLAGLAPSFATDVNCGIVMKSVKMGRSNQDIAETMMISTSDIEKCKKEAAAAPAAAAPKPGEPPNSREAGHGQEAGGGDALTAPIRLTEESTTRRGALRTPRRVAFQELSMCVMRCSMVRWCI